MDRSVVGMENEIEKFILCRYISTSYAIWRLLEFPIHEHFPPVEALEVHLENGERMYFNPDDERPNVADLSPRNTKLTQFFKLCQEDEFALSLLYCEVPRYYRWIAGKNGRWQRRKTGTEVEGYPDHKMSKTIGRIHTVSPKQEEAFMLRLLLTEVTGPTSFEVLRTLDGIVHPTFKSACRARGLLEDDNHLNLAMQEAEETLGADALRSLFCIILVHAEPNNPKTLWENYQESMSDDIIYEYRREHPDEEIEYDCQFVTNQVLIKIEDKLLYMSGKSNSSYSLPEPERTRDSRSYEMIRETSYSKRVLKKILENIPKLNDEQKEIFEAFQLALENGNGGFWFIDAPGGTGKTFLTSIFLAYVRDKGFIALAVASSGIAATLLIGGRTAHATFSIPLNLDKDDKPVCNLGKNEAMAKVIKECVLIVWDECTMSHRKAFEAVDRLLRDLADEIDKDKVMGGKLVIMTGDFRQTLPVVPRGTVRDQLQACIKTSPLWHHVEPFHLSQNVRVQLSGDPDGAEWAKVLLQIGEGKLTKTGIVKVPEHSYVKSEKQLIEEIFPSLSTNYKNEDWLASRAILAPKNDAVTNINDMLLRQIPVDTRVYLSRNFLLHDFEAIQYPSDVLEGFKIPGVPDHRLHLKIGAPVILMRNLDPPKLVNGTRMIITKLDDNVIEAKILVGQFKGELVVIPRIPIIPNNFPIQFKRLQFPIKLSFSMTINKAQGQTLQQVGLYLQESCFSHGQFYVGCSRVGTDRNLKVFCPNQRTKNVVYPEALGEIS